MSFYLLGSIEEQGVPVVLVQISSHHHGMDEGTRLGVFGQNSNQPVKQTGLNRFLNWFWVQELTDFPFPRSRWCRSRARSGLECLHLNRVEKLV